MLVDDWLAWQVYAVAGKNADDDDSWSLLSLWAAAGLWMGVMMDEEALVWDIERALPQLERSNRS